MSTDTDDDGHSPRELREMDEQTARQTLTVGEFERWESLQDLYDQAEATRERFSREDDRVHDLTVHADPEALGTQVTVYGNDLLVHLDSDDPAFRAVHEEYQDLVGDTDADNLAALEDNREAVADAVVELLDCLILRWNGWEWDDLPQEQRRAVLADARAKWGFDALMLAWADVMGAIREDREEAAEMVKSFRGEKGRGGR